MDGTTVIVTGATGGIGKETARELAKLGARVILACRSVERANEVKVDVSSSAKMLNKESNPFTDTKTSLLEVLFASNASIFRSEVTALHNLFVFLDDIIKSTNNQKVLVKKMDLASQKSIREFASDVLKTEKKLDVLIHNAAAAETKIKMTEDGLETNMAVNHFGPFLLTHLLIDLLKRSAPSRVIIVSSKMYNYTNLRNPTPNSINPTNTRIPGFTYFISKNASVCFTQELARRLENTGVTANCLHPGVVDTEIFRHVPIPLSWGLKLIRVFFKTPQQGCRTTVYLATSQDVQGVSGKYFRDCREAGLNRAVQDENTVKKVWELSRELSGLKEDDPRI